MSTAEVRGEEGANAADVGTVGMKLEVVVIPVSDVDRAKAFYAGLGWRLDADFGKDGGRVVQFTPPRSQCSVHFGTNMTTATPGSARNYLVVADIQAARMELLGRSVQVTDVFHFANLNRLDPSARLSGPAPDRPSYGTFVSFGDPDGNVWLVQEITARLPGRIEPPTAAFGSATDLARALRRAEAAHGEHEKFTGQRDANWPDWYAAYLIAEQTGGALPQ